MKKVTIKCLNGPSEGKIITYTEVPIHIGSAEGNDLIVSSFTEVSSRHATIASVDSKYVIYNHSSYGVFVDGQSVNQYELHNRCEIKLGENGPLLEFNVIEEGEILCLQCQSKVASESNFCSGCGAKVEKQKHPQDTVNCPKCCADNEKTACFCHKCGYQLKDTKALENLEFKTCPYCGGKINQIASKCMYCQEWLTKEPDQSQKVMECPVCCETIPTDTVKCPYCNEFIQKKKKIKYRYQVRDSINCPMCGEEVESQEGVCYFCGTDLINDGLSSGFKPEVSKETAYWLNLLTIPGIGDMLVGRSNVGIGNVILYLCYITIVLAICIGTLGICLLIFIPIEIFMRLHLSKNVSNVYDYLVTGDKTFVENSRPVVIKYDVPFEIHRHWNWGAFLNPIFWCFGHKYFWKGLLSLLLGLLPPIGFCWACYCGSSGNEWAWKTCKNRNINQFHTKERAWAFWMLIIVVFLIALYFILSIFIEVPR